MLVDSHCHLNYPEFADLPATLQRAQEAGVGCLQTISTKRSEFSEILRIAETDPRIYASIGVHPHEAASHQDLTVQELVKWAAHPKAIGIGETGLDYFYEHSPRAEQQYCFKVHIEAARQTGLPLIVHSRDADEDTVAILKEEYAKTPFTGLIHCFSSSQYLSDESIKIGFLISISGIVTFKKSTELQSIVKDIPIECLLVETDAPYLAPMPHRGRPNEPAFTRLVAQYVAQLKGIEEQELERITTHNFFRLFKKANQPIQT